MTGFFTDMDNTLIFSYKHDIGTEKVCTEIYEGREISFATEKSLNLIRSLNESLVMVPVTTRTIGQFKRINLGIDFKYSLACNGGVLLIDGIRDDEWYEESLSLVKSSVSEIRKAMDFLEGDSRRYFEQQYIENLFLFTKCHEPRAVISDLLSLLDSSVVKAFNNGDKVYVVPVNLSKGMAIRRFLKRVPLEKTISAGDSEFDLSMVTSTDEGIVPKNFPFEIEDTSDIYRAHKDMVFSDELLEHIECNLYAE